MHRKWSCGRYPKGNTRSCSKHNICQRPCPYPGGELGCSRSLSSISKDETLMRCQLSTCGEPLMSSTPSAQPFNRSDIARRLGRQWRTFSRKLQRNAVVHNCRYQVGKANEHVTGQHSRSRRNEQFNALDCQVVTRPSGRSVAQDRSLASCVPKGPFMSTTRRFTATLGRTRRTVATVVRACAGLLVNAASVLVLRTGGNVSPENATFASNQSAGTLSHGSVNGTWI